MFSDVKIVSNAVVNFASRSRIRNRMRLRTPFIERFRACWVTQAPCGLVVMPARWTRRVACSIKNST